MPNRKFWTFLPFDRILKHNLYFYFNLVNNKEKNETERQCCFSDNVAVCAMLSFSVFGGSGQNYQEEGGGGGGGKGVGGGPCVIRLFNFRLKSKIES